MSESKKVYVVTSGIYSDYTINAVYSTREKAAQAIGGEVFPDDFRTEEFNLDSNKPLRSYAVVMTRDGGVLDSWLFGDRALSNANNTIPHVWGPQSKCVVICVYTATNDETAAIKTANEIRTQLIAIGRWPEEVK